MRTYVISDIHGRFDKFINILEQINFTDRDVLYILGDAIDRGKQGIEVLEYIMEHKNILMVKGNHEYMLQQTFSDDGSYINKHNPYFALWMHNGGKHTFKTLIYKRNEKERKRIYEFIKQLPLLYDNIEVNGEIYYLVHGKPLVTGKADYQEVVREVELVMGLKHSETLPSYEKYLVWERVEACETFFDNKTVIFGHTPTYFYQTGIPYDIWYGDKMIGIDCGCGHKNENTRLACLCLDTMEEFYV